jgi:hypothetical protein
MAATSGSDIYFGRYCSLDLCREKISHIACILSEIVGFKVCLTSNIVQGRAITQAVSRRLPTAAPRGPCSNPGLVMCDFAMDKSGAGAGFLRELRFPLANLHSICFSTIIFTIKLAQQPHTPNNKKKYIVQVASAVFFFFFFFKENRRKTVTIKSLH